MPPPIESKPRGTLQRATVQADVGRIIEAYRRVGRDEVSVVPQIIDRGNGRVDLVYAIRRAQRPPVRQINFTGNQAFGKRQLGAVIKTSATNMLSFLTGGDVYDPDRIAQDHEQLRLYYRSKGYADVSVSSAKAEYDPGDEGIYTYLHDRRRPALSLRRIGVICNVPGLDRDKLRSTPPRLSGGAVFDGNALDKTSEASRDRDVKARLSLCPGHPSPSRAMPPRNASTSPS